jgi:hypothetical protein
MLAVCRVISSLDSAAAAVELRICRFPIELELELIQSHMAQKDNSARDENREIGSTLYK